MLRSAAAPYVVPFVAFIGYLALRQNVPVSPLMEQILCVGLMSAILAYFALPVTDFTVRQPLGTIAVGVGVFVLWVAPDHLFPGYRSHWLFTNSILGAPQAGLSAEAQSSLMVLALRSLRAAVLVPILEELFWRAWLMRWIIDVDFLRVPLGAYTPKAFWIVAILFASEHGSYWEVGLMAGIAYNWWMVRTKSLGDLILAHGITNACLSAYVIATGRWEFWG